MMKKKLTPRNSRGRPRTVDTRATPDDIAHAETLRASRPVDPDVISLTEPDIDGKLAMQNISIVQARELLGQIIAAARQEKGWTQTEAAQRYQRKFGRAVDQSMWSVWERGGKVRKGRITGKGISRVCAQEVSELLGVNIPSMVLNRAQQELSRRSSVARGTGPTHAEQIHDRFTAKRAQGVPAERAVTEARAEIRDERDEPELDYTPGAITAAAQQLAQLSDDLEDHRAKITRLNETGEWELDGEIVGPLSLDYFDTLDGITADTPTIEPIEEWITHAPAKNAAGQWV